MGFLKDLNVKLRVSHLLHVRFESLHTNKTINKKFFLIANVVEANFGYCTNKEVNISKNIYSGIAAEK